MSNSPLVSYTRISPNSSNPRNNFVLKFTPHHVAGNLTLEQLGAIMANPARQMSSNYGIDSNGLIAMYCEEKNRSWCSGSPSNDNQAITVEVSNDGGPPDWHVSDKAIDALIRLGVDVCKRNGIKQLTLTNNASGTITEHNYFQATACPGPYLDSKMPYVTAEINKRLKASDADMSVFVRLDPSKGNNQLFTTPNANGKIIAEKDKVPFGLYSVIEFPVAGSTPLVVNGQTSRWYCISFGGAKAYGVTEGIAQTKATMLTAEQAALQFGSPLAGAGGVSQEEYDRAIAERNAAKKEAEAEKKRADEAQKVLDSAETVRILKG